MSQIVVILQFVSGLAWLFPALYLTPRVFASWRGKPSRITMLSAPIAFLAWLMVGFSVRWFVWPQAVTTMAGAELVTWGTLYALSTGLAGWFLSGAIQTRGN